MKIAELFNSRDKKKRLSRISNLVALARADGTLDEIELKQIAKMAIDSGLTYDEVERIYNKPSSIEFVVPKDYRERMEHLYELVLLMMVNEEIHEKEMEFCRNTALSLGFKSGVVDKLIEDMMEMIDKGTDFEMAFTLTWQEAEL